MVLRHALIHGHHDPAMQSMVLGFRRANRELRDEGRRVVWTRRATAALFLYAARGDADAVRAALASGADPNGTMIPDRLPADYHDVCEDMGWSGDPDSNTIYDRFEPIHVAALGQSGEALRELLAAGAQVNATDRCGRTPLWHLMTDFSGSTAASIQLLARAGADLDRGDVNGVTPLMRAAMCALAPNVDALLAAGANPNARDLDGNTALMYAVRIVTLPNGEDCDGEDALELVEVLLRRGADPNIAGKTADYQTRRDLDCEDEERDGFTPLMNAVSCGMTFEGVAQALLDAGADPNATDCNGNTCLHLIAGDPDIGEDMLDLLLAAGARVDLADYIGRTVLFGLWSL